MRVLILIIIIIFFPLGLTRSQAQLYSGEENFGDTAADNIMEEGDEESVRDDFLSLEPDIFSRKLYQKNLKSLDNSEKIKWSFKMADKDIFL